MNQFLLVKSLFGAIQRMVSAVTVLVDVLGLWHYYNDPHFAVLWSFSHRL